MNDFIKEHGKEFIRTLVAVVAALTIAAPPAAQVFPTSVGVNRLTCRSISLIQRQIVDKTFIQFADEMRQPASAALDILEVKRLNRRVHIPQGQT